MSSSASQKAEGRASGNLVGARAGVGRFVSLRAMGPVLAVVLIGLFLVFQLALPARALAGDVQQPASGDAASSSTSAGDASASSASADPSASSAAAPKVVAPSTSYRVHLSDTGWQQAVKAKQTTGVAGGAGFVDGFRMSFKPGSYGGSIQYRAYMRDKGWRPWVQAKTTAGLVNKGYPMEALKIKLRGKIAKSYDVYYRVYVQGYGWLDWAKNGTKTGAMNCDSYIQAVKVRLIKKTSKAPTKVATPFLKDRWKALEYKYQNKKKVKQLVFVQYNGDSDALIVVKKKKGGTWKTVHTCWGYVGAAGIGQASMHSSRTPVGDFGITQAFGILPDPGAKLDYLQVDDSMWWCGDELYYNQLININEHPHNCEGEHLIDYAPHYNYGFFFDYNTNPIVYGAGAAFFFHCTGGTPYTGGCIAVPESSMVRILKIVGPGARLCIYPR